MRNSKQKTKTEQEEKKLWVCKIEGCGFISSIVNQVINHSKITGHNQFDPKSIGDSSIC